jgi:general secretion pathway protein D
MANGTFSQNTTRTGIRFALLSTALLMSFTSAQSPSTSLAEKEASSRLERVVTAQELLMKGDAAYGSGKYQEAVQQYLEARNLIPNAPASADLLAAATERYATAAVQRAAELSRKGDVAAAKELIEKVLAESVAPQHPAALAMRGKLDDPIRTNPALTKEHTKDVDEVRRTLYEADGFFQLGKYDMAKTMYEDVLRIDATNTAARRGMEKIAQQKTDYQVAAHDQTRAEMLAQVDALWELPVPEFVDPLMLNPTETAGIEDRPHIGELVRTIIIPSIDLEQVSIEEAIDYLRARSIELDTTVTDPTQRGVNFVLNLGNDAAGPGQQVRAIRFDLKVNNVPLEKALAYVCDQTRTQYTVDDFAVTIRPVGTDGVDLISRSYKVPPDFLSTDAVAPDKPANDPFGGDNKEEGLLAKRMTAEEKLRSYGVPFPEGAAASYNGQSSTIFVKNTAGNQDIVQQVVDSIAQTEPVQVIVRVTMIKVQEDRLKELGFDWVLNNVGLGGGGITGGDATFLGGGTQGTGNAVDITNGATNPSPLTSGLRSGNSATSSNGIDDLIRKSNEGFSPSPQRAPGVLSLLGLFTDGQVAMMMRGLDQKKGVDLVSKPSTVTRSGQSAKIEIIREFIYPSEYEPPELPQQIGNNNNNNNFNNGNGGGGVAAGVTPVTPAHPTAFEKRNVGTVLEVNPIVSADRKYIELSVKPEMTNFDGFVNYGTPISSTSTDFLGNVSLVEVTANRILQPVFSVIRANTSVTIADGATIMIGGMVEERVQNVNDKVPFLGSVPLFGGLFQSKALKPIRTNVLILVNVELQDPSGKPYRNR